MSKPDWCPQDVWDEVEHIRTQPFHWKGPEEVAVLVARAILSAEKRGEERERRACAQVVMGFVVHHSSEGGVAANPYADANEIAAAIRNRSTP